MVYYSLPQSVGVFSLFLDIRRFDFSEIVIFPSSVSFSPGESGIFIKQVTPGGVAQNAGLNVNDRLVEINGENTEGLSHAQVVDVIKTTGKSLMLLVVDKKTDEYYRAKERNLKIGQWLASVKHLPHKPRITYIRKGPKGFGFTLTNGSDIAGTAIVTFGFPDIVKSVMVDS